MEQRIRRCPYRNDECEREEINDSVLKHMCEGDSYFKCFEYQKIYENRDVKDWADCFVWGVLIISLKIKKDKW